MRRLMGKRMGDTCAAGGPGRHVGDVVTACNAMPLGTSLAKQRTTADGQSVAGGRQPPTGATGLQLKGGGRGGSIEPPG